MGPITSETALREARALRQRSLIEPIEPINKSLVCSHLYTARAAPDKKPRNKQAKGEMWRCRGIQP
jgi:hypothetical protein